MEVLKLLYSSSNPTDPNCPHQKALTAIMQLTPIRDLPVTDDPDSWPTARKSELIQLLSDKYSDVLEQDVRLGTRTLLITWDLLKLQEKYSDPSKTPDAEHRFVALLVEEGIITELITTNWDALVELAHEECRVGKQLTMQSVACGNEWTRNGFRSRLIKIHGCARKVRSNEALYRPFLVATRTDIRTWLNRFEPFKTAFKTILREKTAFFVGLSAQDWNIQDQCGEASFGQETFFSTVPPKVYFAELEIRNSQRAILKAIYGQPTYDGDAQNIDTNAAIPIYAKTLLGSLYLLALAEKANLIATLPNPILTAECQALLASTLQQIKAEVLAKYDGIADEGARWRAVAEEIPYFVSRMLSMYRRRRPPASRRAYEAIGDKHLGQLPESAHEVLDLQWLIFSLAVLHEGINRTFWRLALPAALDGDQGQLQLSNGTASVPVFLLQNDTGLPALLAGGFINAAYPDRNIVIYPGERKRTIKRVTSPARSLPGAATIKEPHELWLRGELEDAASLTELFNNIKSEIALALAA
jgi:hypothetical protein